MTEIPDALRRLTLPALEAAVEATLEPSSADLLQAWRTRLAASQCPPCTARRMAAHLRLYLAARRP